MISVDTKKKELVGDFKNAGQEWRKKGDPRRARVHVDCGGTWGRVAWELQSEQIKAVTGRYTERPRRVSVPDAIEDLGSDPPLVLIGPWSKRRTFNRL